MSLSKESKTNLSKTSNLKKKQQNSNIFIPSVITKDIVIDFIYIDQNIKETLKNILINKFENKCNIEGFIKKNSINIISYSCGTLKSKSIMFTVLFECLICHPIEGMNISCVVKDITKAGIRAELPNDDKTLIIFIPRDHHYNSSKFSSINPGEEIKVKVLGQRFELNDKFISVIAELMDIKNLIETSKKKPKLILKS